MSEREWVVGDVAVGNINRWTGRLMRTSDTRWTCDDGAEWAASQVDSVRPLVVLDPDNEDDLDGLCASLVEAMHAAGDVASAANGVHPATVAAALRDFITPPPPEPQGLGAVAEDRHGDLWVSFHSSATGTWWRDRKGQNVRWSGLGIKSADQIKSQGWSE